jgi:hypothetical protein
MGLALLGKTNGETSCFSAQYLEASTNSWTVQIAI